VCKNPGDVPSGKRIIEIGSSRFANQNGLARCGSSDDRRVPPFAIANGRWSSPAANVYRMTDQGSAAAKQQWSAQPVAQDEETDKEILDELPRHDDPPAQRRRKNRVCRAYHTKKTNWPRRRALALINTRSSYEPLEATNRRIVRIRLEMNRNPTTSAGFDE
jgi:hypothetical protein